MEQQLYELPGGWKWLSVKDLSNKVQYGYTTKAREKGNAQFLRITDIQNGQIKWSGVPFVSVSNKELEKYCLHVDDLIFARSGATSGKSILIINPPRNSIFASYLIRVVPDTKVVFPKFLELFFQSPVYWKQVGENVSGAAQPNINGTKLSGFQVSLPALNEQKHIVNKLDALFTRIDTAITHLQQTLELFKALFESASAHVFKDGEEWDTVKLSVLLERGWITGHLDGNHGGNYPRKAEFVGEGVPYISANCIRNGEVIMGLSKYLTPKRAAMLRKGIAMNNDVLFAHNATVGPVAILRTDCEKVVLSTSLTYYRCDPKYILPEYLAQYMKASPFTSQYRAVMSQSTRNQVPITKQREFTHIIPPLKEQSRIASQLDALTNHTRALEAATQEKLNDLTTLKASLLDAAFKGQL